MKPHRYRATQILLAAGLLVLPSSLLAQQGLSHARVVRLSYVHGTVAIQRPGSTVWANATVNTPIQEGFSLSTSSDSFAEVEFEDGSTARLGELSKMDFSQLALTAGGYELNRLALDEGYATFHFTPEHGDVFSVKVSGTTLTPRGKAEFRTNFDQGRLQVEVFDGSVGVEGPAGSAKVGKDKVLDFDTQASQAFKVHAGIEKDDWDKWVEARDQQAVLAYNDSAMGQKSPMYGWSDLDAYGEWAYYPGYGNGWTPYAPVGWTPYSLGMWSWYSGFGWTWISSDPWGWLPYHCGFWNLDAAFGWFWMPGGCGMWSPALVTWYGGAGWIGWAPAGTQGGGVTAVPPGTVQSGQPINPGTRIPGPPHRPRPMSGPPFPPSQLAMLGGTPVPPNVVLPGRAAPAGLPGGGTSGVGRPRPAPPSVLMGVDPKAERAQLEVHQSLLERAAHVLGASGPHPVYAHLGTTLGGRFPVTPSSGGPATGISRGPDRMGGSLGHHSPTGNAPHGFGGSGPALLAHGSSGGGSGGGRSGGGGFSGSGHSSGGGSAISSSSSVSASSSSPSASSGGHSGGGSSGGGGGHH